MKRVLIVEAAGNLWGSERALIDLIEGITDLDVAVCCPPATPLVEELKKRGIYTFGFFRADLHLKSRVHRLWAAFGVVRACFVFRPDVIHLNQSGSYRVVLLAAMLWKLPIVAHVRIFEDVAYLARQTLRPTRLVGMIAISEAIEAEIRRSPQLAAIPLHRIYDAYAPSGAPRSAEVRIENRIICLGRIALVKGQDILIDALALLRGSAESLVVGDGDPTLLDRLKRAATDKGVSLQWLGFVHDVIPLLRTASVLVCPSHREPLGRVIFEAWDAGCVPVVFGGGGGSAEVVRASGGGIVYTEQTPESLAAALEMALALDPTQRNELVAKGRSWMTANCDPSAYGRIVSTILSGG
jgi:glycosyltransferase involved in cell wall biosynthesis